MRRAIAAIAIGASLAAGGCERGVVEAVDAAGEWQLEAGTLDARAIPTLIAHPITMLIEAGRVTGVSACNRYEGSLAAAGASFHVTPLSGTAMGCEPAVLESEAAFMQALAGITSARRADERLVLAGPGIELTFRPLRPIEAGPLVDTEWVLDTLVSGGVASSAAGDPATLALADDGTFSGSTGCRRFAGTYLVQGGAILVTQMAMNGECAAALAEQDTFVVSVVDDGFRATVEHGLLSLQDQGGLALVYRAAP